MAQQSVEPGQIERRIEQTKPEKPRSEPEIRGLPARPAPPKAPSVERFVLAAVIVNGATVFDPVEFSPYYEKLLATEISLADVEAILARITKRYRDAGYILSRAVAPPQNLAAGVLRIDVVEGYIDDVIFDGTDVPQEMLAPYAARISAERPLRRDTLERYVLLMSDVSGIRVEPQLREIDAAQGRYALVMKTTYRQFDGLAFVNNRGTPAVGRLQGWASGGMNGALGWRERFQVGLFTIPTQPRELVYVEGVYSQALGDDGWNYSVLASQSEIDGGSEQDIQGIESSASRLQLRVWYPIIRSSKRNLWLNGILHYQNFHETAFDQTTTDDRLRVFRLSLSYWQAHDNGTTNLFVEASKGLNILDETDKGSSNLSRVDGQSDFTKLTAFITRQQGIGGNFGLQLQVGGQWSAQPLLSSEEFALGGTRFGRAYDFSEISGDMALAGSVELRYGKNLDNKWLQGVQLYTFYDIGSVWNEAAGIGRFRDSLSSVGGGIRLTGRGNIRLNLEVAKPLTRPVDTRDNTETRGFFNLSASF